MFGRALAKGLWSFRVHDLRCYSDVPSHRVDDTPYGGGPGMVMKPEVIFRGVEAALSAGPALLVCLTPAGRSLNHMEVTELAQHQRLMFVCGRFEGIDRRVIDYYQMREVSIGDYVVSGGEVAAMVVMEAVLRLVPGVLGNYESVEEESFVNERILEYPQYTKPAVWRNRAVPPALLSGNHKEISKWRERAAEELTAKNRSDLVE